jgi:hypothetical protein
MASRMAERFNARARPRLTAEHAETVTLTDTFQDEPVSLPARWRRLQPLGNDADGLGLVAYTGQATAVVLRSDMATDPGPESTITRNGETWAIRFVEPLDEWSVILHLSKPEDEDRMPGRLRG